MSSDDPRATRERITVALDAFDDGWAKGFAAAKTGFLGLLSSPETVEAARRAARQALAPGIGGEPDDEDCAVSDAVLAAVRDAVTGEGER